MGKPMSDPAQLSSLLANLEALVIDDAAAREQQRAVDRGAAYEARLRRHEALTRESVPLDAKSEAAILDGGGELEPTRALCAVRAWLARPVAPPVLVLSGGTGTGKSVAAAWALAENRTGIWRTAAQLCRTFAASFGDQYEDQELCFTAGLLVADDVGAELERERERMGATLVELLEHRKRSARYMRTIISTNLNRAAFERRYASERLLSRMAREAGVVAWVETKDADLRRRA
jgi:DNA replication protein DnaC